jgi:hypothetical protein
MNGCTGAALGTGDYCHGVPFLQLRSLLREGKSVMQARGLDGEILRKASRLYVRATLLFHQQSGWEPLSGDIASEFADRILAELAVSRRSHHHSDALSTNEFGCGERVNASNIPTLEQSPPNGSPTGQSHSPPR